MNDLDLEDIESRLYSQVYHSINDETEQNLIPNPNPTPQLSKPTNDMRRSSGRYFGPWSPGAKFQNKNTLPKPNHQRPPIHRDFNKSDGFYSKDSGRPHRSDIPVNQVVVVNSLQPVPVVYMSNRQARKANWKAKVLEKKKQKRNRKQQQQKQAQKEKQLTTDTVIILSDSDEDSCVVVENKGPVLAVAGSDEEKKKTLQEEKLEEIGEHDVTLKNDATNVKPPSSSDDVIFVEPAPIEVINLDEEFVSHEENMQNVETASSSFDSTITNSPTKDKVQQVHQERKELLSTPDSASNDFMNNSGLELHGTNFNFSLHGSDFHSGEFLKPAARNETCETESSSSTTDANSVNLMKSAVFNEVDFPKDDIFSDNLENFGNFITPLRRNATMAVVQSSPIAAVQVHNQSKNQKDSSDSSSESELEESQIDKQKDTQKGKNLPELSPMQRNKDANKSQMAKKSKKVSNICSKFDLLNSGSPTPTKDAKQKNVSKKKKRNKKKKSSECGVDTNLENVDVINSSSVEPNVVEAESTFSEKEHVEFEDQLKQKKRRSNHFEGCPGFENQPKKKTSLREELQNTESVENVNDEFLQPNENKNAEESTSVSQLEKNRTDTEVSLSNENEVNCEKELPDVSGVEGDPSGEQLKHMNDGSFEITMIENTLIDKSEQAENSTFNGLIIVDEVNQDSMVLSSDSESVLSALHEDQDIQINCEERENNTFASPEPNGFDHFSVQNMQFNMSNDPSLWKILESDRTPTGKSKGRRCNRCRQFGHMAIRCPNKVEVKCALCGGSGHYEPRCPNKICTQCGQRSSYSTTYCSSCFKFRNHVCQLCSMVGHNSKTCPDLWRRYYLTTTEGPLTKYEGPVLKHQHQLWCSGCAQPGHLEHSCRFYKSIYPVSDPFIKSYEDIYKEKERNVNRTPEQRPPVPQNHGINSVNPNFFMGAMNQRNVGFNYNHNNYGPMNHQFMNPFMDGLFVANQQNFFPPGSANIIQIPQNNFPGNHNQIVFENPLPAFISFDVQDTANNYNQVPVAPNQDFGAAEIQTQANAMRRHNYMFFSSSGLQLQHFVHEELHRLSKMSLLSNKVVKEFRKRPVPRRDNTEKEEYYETLNMLLFGIYNLSDGKMHLERLKKFKRERLRAKVGNGTRRRLHTSYCYIFGRGKHNGVDYKDLLRRI